MEQTVYADLYFMINLSMDFLCFFLTAKILSIKLHVWRALIASALGGVYAVAALFFTVGKLTALLTDMAVCACICLFAFARKKELRSAFMYTPVYIAVSMAIGGFMTALFNLFNRLEMPLPETDSDGMSVRLFAILAVSGGIAVLLGGRFFAKRSARKNAEITVAHKGKSVGVRALCDSGNLLREPISGLPCVLVELDALDGVFSASFRTSVKKRDIISLSSHEASRIRMIPARSVSGDSLLFGMRVDSLRIDMGKGATEVEAYLAFSVERISADGVKALVPSELALGAA